MDVESSLIDAADAKEAKERRSRRMMRSMIIKCLMDVDLKLCNLL